jgi:hypothetical protein
VKLKLDDKGNVVMQDGKPVYIADDGKEVVFDAVHSVNTIARLNREAQGHREAKETAENALKVFEGLDPKTARTALETVKNLNDKKLVDAGEVQRVKDETIKATQAQYEPVIKERDALKSQLDNAMIGGNFSRSKFIGEKLTLPSDIVQARFGSAFKFENGKVIGYHGDGQKIYSRAKPGDVADFEEALEILVDGYPQRDIIMKAKGQGGSGTPANAGGAGNNKKTITRTEFAQLQLTDPVGAASKMREGVAVVDG